MTARRWAWLGAILMLLAACHPSNRPGTPPAGAKSAKSNNDDGTYLRPQNAAPCQKVPFAKSYAVVIGVQDYDYVQKLDASDSDALHVRDFLLNEACFDRVDLLRDDNATKDRIAQLMETDFPNLVKPHDRFLFYFTGHGATRPGTKRGYLLLKKSHKEAWHEMIDMQQISVWAEALGNARHVLFVLDSCFSGRAVVVAKDASTATEELGRLSQPSSYLLTASGDQERSFEYKGSSIFTQAFLAVARGQFDPPASGIVSLNGLAERIGRFIDEKKKELNDKIKMSPQLEPERADNNEGEFFFMVRPKQKATNPVFAPRPSFRDCTDCPEMISIPAGEFMMGSPDGQEDESPQHRVRVPGFSVEEWDACVADGFCKTRPEDKGRGHGKRPVINLNWDDAQDFVRWRLSQKARHCPDCPEMVSIPAGEFMMGSPDGQEDESPQHRVRVPGFSIGKYDVTFAEWDACVAAGGCKKHPDDLGWGRARRPVINVTWRDAQEYAHWLSQKTRHSYRLPSEAEWEYAARAGTVTPYYWGKGIGEGKANCKVCGSDWDGKQTAPVGSFDPNPWGIYDMAGNVDNWVQDCWHNNYHGAPVDGSAWEGKGGSFSVDPRARPRAYVACGGRRVFRGGSWNADPQSLRSAIRLWNQTDFSNDVLGFRVARTD